MARREAVGWLQTRGTSLRRACRVIGLSTATWRYQRTANATNLAVLARLQAHAAVRARFGYRRLHIREDYYNYHRPHGALDGQTPYERLVAKTKARSLPAS